MGNATDKALDRVMAGGEDITFRRSHSGGDRVTVVMQSESVAFLEKHNGQGWLAQFNANYFTASELRTIARRLEFLKERDDAPPTAAVPGETNHWDLY